MLLQLNASELFQKNYEAKTRIVADEGGTRSGKTISLAQLFLTKLYGDEKRKLSIVRKTLPALKATAMEDFFNMMKDLDIYEKAKHNRTDHIYSEGRNTVEFFSVDDQQKVRGRKRDDLWINEANELSFHEFSQLAFRTSGQIFMDYNPVEEDHWIVEKVLTRPDVTHITSNYRDNPFLPDELIKEIEMLQAVDENYWRVFGLGLRPQQGTKIYSHYQLVDDFPENPDEIIAGIDFGFNNPSAIIRIAIKDGVETWDELFYASYHTNSMLIEKMEDLKNDGQLDHHMNVYADAAEPARIKEIEDAGYNIRAAVKAVTKGIDHVKSRPLRITKRSVNLIDNMKKYMWKTTRDGKILDEPVKANDHGPDAGRYASYTHHLEGSERPRARLL